MRVIAIVPAHNEAANMKQIVALIPAHAEGPSIAVTIESMLAQTRVPDKIIVILDNCPDNTPVMAAQAAEGHAEVTVVATEGNTHRKSGALNMAWNRYAKDAWMVVGVDGDTILPPNAVADWSAEFEADASLGGSSSKFTMPGTGLLTRLQRAEFSSWTETSIRRGHTSVLAGTGCAVRGEALRMAAGLPGREGPWTYTSAVEDFELTYQIRAAGWHCQVSSTVPAYTDSMKTIKALWGQRMKWQCGTVEDLMSIGFNRLTARDWAQQCLGLLSAMIRFCWVFLWVGGAITGWLHPNWTWYVFPLFFMTAETISSFKIPDHDWKDVLIAASLLPGEFFCWLRAGWFVASWYQTLFTTSRDRWAAQYAAESIAGSEA